MSRSGRIAVLYFLCFLFLAACQKTLLEKTNSLTFETRKFSDLKGWKDANLADSFTAFRKSCAKLITLPDTRIMAKSETIVADWKPACQLALAKSQDSNARAFFERYFTPYLVTDGQNNNGLFTGYYELDLKGSRTKSDQYQHALYKMPKGMDVIPGRRRIENGELAGKGLELLYVDDPVRAFFLHIQGSGRVQLGDGSWVRVGYAGKNQCPYRALGKYLIEHNDIAREDMSAEKIQEWLYANPFRARAIMNYNPSYVFFRELSGDGPIGGQGVALTEEVSLAIDDDYIPYGAPMWLETSIPTKGAIPVSYNKLLIAQDTGGAIRGPVRGDVFFGFGKRAEFLANNMKQNGKYYMFFPKKKP